jgi:hypothetical protein
MKATFLITVSTIVTLLCGCASTTRYTGEGQILDTTARHDGLVRIPEYTIELASFGLNTNFTREFHLGNVAFFRDTAVSVNVRFKDDRFWRHLAALPASMKTPEYLANYRSQDVDRLESHLHLKLTTNSGEVLFESDKKLKEYVWGMRQLEGGLYQFDIYERGGAHLEITRDDLSLNISYTGDPTLTAVGKLLLICRPK